MIKTNSNSVTIDGITYRSVEFAYKQLSPEISLSSFRRKIRNGILDINELTKKHKDFIILGFHYSDTRTAYEDLEPPIPLSVFRSRVSNGVPDDKLFLPVRKDNGKPLTYFGKTYKTVKSAYNDLKPDTSLNTFYWRVKHGYTDERLVLSSKTNLERNAIVINGHKYVTIKKAYEALRPNVTLLQFYKCIRDGMTDDELINL